MKTLDRIHLTGLSDLQLMDKVEELQDRNQKMFALLKKMEQNCPCGKPFTVGMYYKDDPDPSVKRYHAEDCPLDAILKEETNG